jgi:hypothetical protein
VAKQQETLGKEKRDQGDIRVLLCIFLLIEYKGRGIYRVQAKAHVPAVLCESDPKNDFYLSGPGCPARFRCESVSGQSIMSY